MKFCHVLVIAQLVLCACSCCWAAKQSNIILLLTDDQDLVLGGMTPLAFTKDFMETRGAEVSNFFVNTPVCCPSRTTLLTGDYPHNWHTIKGGCMHMNVSNSDFKEKSLGVQMKSQKYTTGMFGKLLNPGGVSAYCAKNNPEPLPGFDDYMVMCNDNRYFENTFSKNGKFFQSGKDPEDYLTSLIGNATIDFVKKSLENNESFFAYVAPHAPHVPATPAPWYADKFTGQKAPRTPSYNYSALDHHYVIRSQPPINAKVENMSDSLFENRWRSLLSVDDIMKDLVELLTKNNALDNTYFVLTSDHGYNLGQLRLPSCKLQPYEHDIRVPFHIVGPGIPAGTKYDFVAGMVDVAPTLLSLGQAAQMGGQQPLAPALAKMDGKSFADLLMKGEEGARASEWRDKHMIEYWSLGNVIRLEHYIDMPNNTYIGVRLINSTHNFLYAEFYDGVDEVSFLSPLEYELFDVAKDPYQLVNIYGTAETKDLAKELHDFIHKQIVCKGSDCV